MIKKIILKGAAPVGAVIRTPAQGPLSVPDDISETAARALIGVGLAKDATAGHSHGHAPK